MEQLSDGDIVEAIRDQIFSLPLLPQKQVLELFEVLDASLFRSIETLTANSNFVERYLTSVISEVAASTTHGRTIYAGARPASEDAAAGEASKVFRRASDIRFLERAFPIVRMLARGSKEGLSAVLHDVTFVRLVYEEILGIFEHKTTGYEDAARSAAHQHQRARGEGDVREAHELLVEANDRMDKIERDVGFDRQHLYHVCRAVGRNRRHHTQIRDIIYEPYLRIVYKEAKKHATNRQQILENFQNGAQGLLRAISCYDVAKNVSFSSYAHWWVRQAILYHIKDSSNFVKLPVTTWQTHTAIERVRSRLATRDGDDSVEQLSNITGHSVDKIKEIYASVRSSHVHSLDYEVDDSGKMMMLEVIADPADEERRRHHEIQMSVIARIDDLDPDERTTLCLFYGLFGLLRHDVTSKQISVERGRQRGITTL